MSLKKTIFIITGFLLICSLNGKAQTRKDIAALDSVFMKKTIQKSYEMQDASNELEWLLNLSFVIYKNFISSQDALSCVFYPSCSAYAFETIKKNALLGVLDAIDRLTRCHGFAPNQYSVHEPSKLFYDPVK